MHLSVGKVVQEYFFGIFYYFTFIGRVQKNYLPKLYTCIYAFIYEFLAIMPLKITSLFFQINISYLTRSKIYMFLKNEI